MGVAVGDAAHALRRFRACHTGSAVSAWRIVRSETKQPPRGAAAEDYFLRWRIFARMRRFLRPSFRRPFPDFLVPKAFSVFEFDRAN